MKNQCKAILVKIFQGLRKWGPLVALAVIVPGGSVLALVILRQQQHHAHGGAQ